MTDANIFIQIGYVIIIATLGGYIAKLFKQPLIPAYILVGLIIGPILGIITNSLIIASLSEIGIAFLLFIVGLEINLDRLKHVAGVATVGGVIQVALMFTAGFLIALCLGFLQIEAAYIGLIIAFSSTMVVVKILSDKKQIDTLHGRIILGILLMQDILAMFALLVLTTLNEFSFLVLVMAMIKGVVLLAVALFASKYVFPSFFKFAARSQELLFLVSITVMFLFSILFARFGFSIAIGAFVGGLTIGSLPYNIEIIGKLKSLRDFFATIFFVSLGLGLSIMYLKELVVPLILLTLVVVLFKPFITIILCNWFGYKKHPAFLTGISLGQVSEFGLIVVFAGLTLGHISDQIYNLAIFLAIITIALTSYFMGYDNKIYALFAKKLAVFEKISRGTKHLEYVPDKMKKDVILVGYNRTGYSIVNTLKKTKKSFLVVDYNPEVVKTLIEKKVPCIYGDIGDTEIVERMNLKKAKLIISTIDDHMDNKLLIRHAKKANKKLLVFVVAAHVRDALELYDFGADYVILPHLLGGEKMSFMLEHHAGKISKLLKEKLKHIKQLQKRHS
ncbi:MAG: cation:proton antiporter [Nanoarchaeota archaeon]|nr:cation:proton antiporter [Nanoarchaeota archaeon]